MIQHAIDFAKTAHEGQKRKYTDEPYHAHVIRVGDAVRKATTDSDVICAAYLHDVIEDTEVTAGRLMEEFNERVALLVLELTNEFTKEAYPYLNRADRKELECKRLVTCSADARLIKMFDINDNITDLVILDPEFAVTYLREKAEVVQAMTFGNFPALLKLVAGK